MKKYIVVFAVCLGLSMPVFCLDLGDDVKATLLSHVQTATQFGFGNDEDRIALLDSIIQIGSHNGQSIVDLQLGYAGKTEDGSDSFLGGGLLRLDTLISDNLKLPSHWEFLRAVEHGPSVFYDFDEDEWYGSYQIGLSFSLDPIE